jgi:hypothetical protein
MKDMKNTLFITSFCLSLVLVQAQNKYEKIVYQDLSQETGEMSVQVKDLVSTKEAFKFKLKIQNKGSDILLYKPEESVLKANTKDFKPKEKWMEMPPGDADSKVINFEGTNYLMPGMAFELSGVYKISNTDAAIEAPEFELPASKNEFTAGNFSCNMLQLSKETDKTEVKFECRYTGDKFGVINPGRAAVKLPDGSEIANAKSKKSPIILMKGESEKFTMSWERMEGGKAQDMQKIKMMIVWRNTFVESEAMRLPPVNFDIKIDEGKSK